MVGTYSCELQSASLGIVQSAPWGNLLVEFLRCDGAFAELKDDVNTSLAALQKPKLSGWVENLRGSKLQEMLSAISAAVKRFLAENKLKCNEFMTESEEIVTLTVQELQSVCTMLGTVSTLKVPAITIARDEAVPMLAEAKRAQKVAVMRKAVVALQNDDEQPLTPTEQKEFLALMARDDLDTTTITQGGELEEELHNAFHTLACKLSRAIHTCHNESSEMVPLLASLAKLARLLPSTSSEGKKAATRREVVTGLQVATQLVMELHKHGDSVRESIGKKVVTDPDQAVQDIIHLRALTQKCKTIASTDSVDAEDAAWQHTL
eukprot:4608198-Amphidinium_carterae.2